MTVSNKKISLLILVLFLLSLAIPNIMYASWYVDSSGNVSYSPSGQVLGDDDEEDEEEREGDEDESDDDEEEEREDEKEEENENEQEYEYEYENESKSRGNANQNTYKEKIKVKQKNGESEYEYELESKDNRFRIKSTPNQERLQLKLTDYEGQELEFEAESETDSIEIEQPKYKNTLRIRAKENAQYVIKSKVAAKTNYPLMVNPDTNELIVTTPKGSKVVTVLPDAAVANMLAANVLDEVGGKGGLLWTRQQEAMEPNEATSSGDLDDDDSATDSAEIEDDENEATDSADVEQETEYESSIEDEAEDVIEMVETEDGTLAYEIEGFKTKKLFGFRNIQLYRQAVVSAETGELIQVRQDFWNALLDVLSTD